MFKGIYTALITPFKEDFNVDYDKLSELIDFQINNKVDGIVICGTTAETSNLDETEYETIIRLAVSKIKNSGIKIIAGVGTNNYIKTKKNIELCETIGVDGLLIVTPYYIKPSQRSIEEYFKILSSSTKLPIVLYDIPGRTGVKISNEVILRLSKIDNIVGVKDATGDLSSLSELKSMINKDFSILSGDDGLFYEQLMLGANGIISVITNVYPDRMRKIYESYLNKDYELSKKLHEELKKISTKMYIEGNPTTVKAYMKIKRMIDNKIVRLPLIETSKETDEILSNL